MGNRTFHSVNIPDPNNPGSWIATGEYTVTDDRTLSDGLAEASSRLAQQYQSLYEAGRNYLGKNFQIDPTSLQNVNGAASMALVAMSAGGWPANFVWIASDNTALPLATAQEMIAFGQNIGAYVTALVMTNRALKDVVAALIDIPSCDAFDVTQGWPAN